MLFQSKEQVIYKGFRTIKREGKSDLTFLEFGDPVKYESLSFMPTQELDNYSQIPTGTPVEITLQVTAGQRGVFCAVSALKPLNK
ncbi:hypothetical protein CMALT430_490019 [Carnobacterium maltaromaticum]|uniref:hypothetical protein n=1 Tax=Carnobacterium maltaromaticum TaxID=2751 RepID=UPI00191BA904|nr:hypothetical protein [Carnobacterium maltaromaticum]CAD5901337.1 hypothetical protein CMALT430_490019 [Carnobacterium maltaromaticum]